MDVILTSDPRADRRKRKDAGLVPGELFAGRYQAMAEIARGATGQLYLASDLEQGGRIVVKRAADAELVRAEADVLSALVHPNVVRLNQRHDAATPPFLLLDLVEGADLEAYLTRHGGTLDEIVLGRLLLQLCDTVTFVHAKGYLHRDLKPGNVLIRPDGSPVIVDFGAALPLARAGAGEPWSFVTEGYAAPEQYFADRPEGPWTDVYGLGAIGYRALAGHAPGPALVRAGGALGEPLAKVGARAQALRRAIDWALEPEAADRPQSVAAWRERLAAALDEADKDIASPAATATAESDAYPPTIRVARARHGNSGRRAADRPPDAAPTGPWRVRILPIVLVLGVLAALAAAAIYGWPLYERYVKTEWLVDQAGGGDATTISDALLRARDDATIRVGPGTYRESLRLERPATLVALDGATPVVAPESGPCVLVTSRTGSITGLDLRAAPATDPHAATPCVILAGGAVSIEGNRISAAVGPGLVIRDGAAPVVRGNRLEGAGLVVRGGADPSLSENVIEGGGVVFAEGASGSLTGNRLAAGAGIRVATGASPRIVDNTIEGAEEAGIYVYDGGSGRFERNTITGSGLSGVVIEGGGRPELVANTVRDSAEHGILVVEGGRALLEGNQAIANRGHGIALGAKSEVELADNRLEGNDEPQLLDAR